MSSRRKHPIEEEEPSEAEPDGILISEANDRCVENGHTEYISRILKEADTKGIWVDHRVILDSGLTCNRSRIAYDGMRLEVYVPMKLSHMPTKVFRTYLRNHMEYLYSGCKTFGFGKDVVEYLNTKGVFLGTRKALHINGVYDMYDDVVDSYLVICKRAAMKQLPMELIRDVDVVWGKKPMKDSIIAMMSAPARLIVVDRSIGYGNMFDMVYLMIHEMLAYMCYSIKEDNVDEISLQKMIAMNPKWAESERIFLEKGWRFRHCTTLLKTRQ